MSTMYIPLPLRLTLFYAIVLGGALGVFGTLVYNQAEQRAYADLRDTLSNRAASVRLGKDILFPNAFPGNKPLILPDVNGTQSVAIEVLDNHLHLLATTSAQNSPLGTGLDTLKTDPVPWDAQAAQQVLAQSNNVTKYSTITYQNRRYLVYTLLNDDLGSQHIIQTASSLTPIEQSLNNLRTLLLRGAVLVLACALVGGWFISWGVLKAVQRITRTARAISASTDLSKRIPDKAKKERDELAILTATFNEMLSSLQEMYQRQQRFVADASHELRAPITAIRCNLDLLAKAPDLPPEEVQAALTDTRAEAERMGRLVNDLLLLAHADAQGSSTLAHVYKKDRQKVDLDSLLLAIYRQYRPLEENVSEEAGKRGPRLTLQHIEPAQVYGDRDQFTQALVALLDNALKYTLQEGQVALSLTVVASEAVVKVSDTGIGIAKEDLPHIFERFYRAQQAQTRKHSGSGLGLAIVQSIAREHNGTIAVESVQGVGSTFTLRLPLVEEKTF